VKIVFCSHLRQKWIDFAKPRSNDQVLFYTYRRIHFTIENASFFVIFVRNNPGDSRAPSCFFLVKNPLTAKKQVACLSSQFIMTLRPPIHSASLQHHWRNDVTHQLLIWLAAVSVTAITLYSCYGTQKN